MLNPEYLYYRYNPPKGTKQRSIVGWKVFKLYSGVPLFEYNFHRGSNMVPVGVWLEANPVGIDTDLTNYRLGFHAFLSRTGAIEYMRNRKAATGVDFVLAKVHLADVRTVGTQFHSRVAVADYMYVFPRGEKV